MSSEPRTSATDSRVGLALYVGHLLTVFGIALSNGLLGLALLWSGVRREVWGRVAAWRQAGARVLLLPLALYVVSFALSALFSVSPRASFDELGGAVFTLLAVPLGLLLLRGEETVRRVCDLLLITLSLLAVHGLGQFLFAGYGPLSRRIPGAFSHYMTFSGILLLGVCLALGRLCRRDGWRRPLNWVALVLLQTALLLTLTRSAWIASIVLIVLVLWLRLRWIAAIVGLLLVAALLLAIGSEYRARALSIFDLKDPSNYERLCMTWSGLRMIEQRPLLGIGPNTIKERFSIYRHPSSRRAYAAHLHNTLLNIAAERGLLSVAAYLWLMAATLYLAWRGFAGEGGRDGPRADLYVVTALAVIGINVAGLFEANWRDTEVQRVLLFLMILPVCLRLKVAEEPTDPSLATHTIDGPVHPSTSHSLEGAPR